MTVCDKSGKVMHATRDNAKAAIRSLYQHGRGNPGYRAYPCDDHWHIGHSRIALKKRIRRALRRQA